MSIASLVLHASWVVQLVMLILVGASVACWATILRKVGMLKAVKNKNEAFETDFWSGSSLNELYQNAMHNVKTCGPMERIFASGMREYQKLRERHISNPDTLLDGTFRPDARITRAEAMTMINRVLCRMPQSESDLLDSMVTWPDNKPSDWHYLAVQEATNSHDFNRQGEVGESWTKLTSVPDWTRYQ